MPLTLSALGRRCRWRSRRGVAAGHRLAEQDLVVAAAGVDDEAGGLAAGHGLLAVGGEQLDAVIAAARH
jgi:hypothetical protein